MTFLKKWIPLQPPLAGLDITQDSVKLIALRRQKGGFSLMHCVSHPCVPDLQTALEHVREGAHGKVKRVAVAVPHNWVYMQRMPAVQEQKALSMQIQQQVRRALGNLSGALSLDFKSLPLTKEVLWIATPQEKIKRLIKAVSAVNWKVFIIDAQAFAFARGFYAHPSLTAWRQTVLPVAVYLQEASQVTFWVLHEGQVVYFRQNTVSLPAFGLNTLEKQVLCHSVAQQCIKWLQDFYTVHDFRCVQAIILSGQDALPLASVLQAQLSIPTFVEPQIAFLTAYGLALRRFYVN